jgi:hypothetical protein
MNRKFVILTMALACIAPALVIGTLMLVSPKQHAPAPNSAILMLQVPGVDAPPVAYA